MTAIELPQLAEPLKPADFRSNQEVRWCPGCGDHVVLATVQSFFASLRIPRENIVVISGIGCSSRFPYYVETYGMHSIHGRAPSIATGVAINRPDLSVWVITGDGDALSIGGNHLIHALRRNVNLKIILFNNQIYGLTKGQYSPTSKLGTVSKSTPSGSIDNPFDPISVALGAGATFVARTVDFDRKHMLETLNAANQHNGTALVEVYQNCMMFNDDAYGALNSAETKQDFTIRLRDGEPILFGANNERAVVRDPETYELSIGAADGPNVVVHDAATANPAYAFGLAQLADPDLRHTPIGVFRAVDRPTYDGRYRRQLDEAHQKGPSDVRKLLHGTDTWTVSA
ncbi:MAG TPA: 2-oxoacid:ferredoxin oxidoreductase subunit beta [Pseudonocardiaceae bacterium]